MAAPSPTPKMIAAGLTLAIVAQALDEHVDVLGLGPAKGTLFPSRTAGPPSSAPWPPSASSSISARKRGDTWGHGKDMKKAGRHHQRRRDGGHLYPALVVGRKLMDLAPEIALTYVGTRREVEGRIMAEHGVRFIPMRVEGLKGRGLKSLRGLVVLPLAFAHSLLILARTRPALVVGVGGYSSGPIVLLASWFRVPTVILEQNVRPGFTNRLLIAPGRSKAVVAFVASPWPSTGVVPPQPRPGPNSRPWRRRPEATGLTSSSSAAARVARLFRTLTDHRGPALSWSLVKTA